MNYKIINPILLKIKEESSYILCYFKRLYYLFNFQKIINQYYNYSLFVQFIKYIFVFFIALSKSYSINYVMTKKNMIMDGTYNQTNNIYLCTEIELNDILINLDYDDVILFFINKINKFMLEVFINKYFIILNNKIYYDKPHLINVRKYYDFYFNIKLNNKTIEFNIKANHAYVDTAVLILMIFTHYHLCMMNTCSII